MIPKEIQSLRTVKPIKISAGDSCSACISAAYEVYVWGGGSYGRLGIGMLRDRLVPTVIDDLRHKKVEDIELGMFHSVCLLQNGGGYIWGGGKNGKLGIEDSRNQNFTVPKPLSSLEKQVVTQFAAGPFHTVAMTERGKVARPPS